MRTISLLLAGAATGVLYGLIAVGIVVTYLTTRTLNFAAGAVATLAAFTFGTWVKDGWPKVLALVATLLFFGIGGGYVTGRVVMGRVRTASETVRAAVILGWTLGITGITALLYNTLLPVPAFFGDASFAIATVRLTSHQVAVAATAAALAVGLSVFLRRAWLGLALRAVAENRDSARALGLRVDRVEAFGWMCGMTLAALGGVLVSPLIGGDLRTQNLLFIKVLAVSVLAGMERPWLALTAGVGLGMAEAYLGVSGGFWTTNLDLLPFIVMVTGLAVVPFLQANRMRDAH
ncbi:MAG: branched-chain amino acid ABC transporter permease [Actinomycetota bacterium]